MESDCGSESSVGTEIRARTLDCRELWDHCASRISTVTGMEWCDFRQAEFNIWSQTIRAVAQDKSSLDYRLRHHSELRNVVCNLLDSLVEALDDLLQLTGSESYLAKLSTGNDSDEEMSSDDSDDESEIYNSENDGHYSPVHFPEIQSGMVDIQKFYVETTISQLTKLSTKIRESGSKYRYLRADASLNRHDFDNDIKFWINDILSRKFRQDAREGIPTILENPEYLDPSLLTIVQKRLVDANLLRLNRIRFAQRRTITRQDQVVETQQNFVGNEKQQIIPENYSLDHEIQAEQPDVKQRHQDHIATPLLPYTATAVGSQLTGSKIAAIAEPSVASQATRIGKRADLEYPKCPKPLTDGASLVCPYCSDILPSNYQKSSSSWRKHVAQDILPYVCYYERCSTPDLMYSNSDDLMRHIDNYHSQPVWYCMQCFSDTDSNPLTLQDEQSWESHMHHEHNCPPTSAEYQVLASACQERSAEAAACPLCQPEADQGLADDGDHILWHIHQFALNCLPWDGEEDWGSNKGMDTIHSQERIDNDVEDDWSLPSSQDNHQLLATTPKSEIEVKATWPEPDSPLGPKQANMASTSMLDFEEQSFDAMDGIHNNYFEDAMLMGQITDLEAQIDDDSIPLNRADLDPELTKLTSYRPEANLKPEKLASNKPVAKAESKTIRGSGACFRCRIQRAPCSLSGTCSTCSKAWPKAPDNCCIRKDFGSVSRELSSRRFLALHRKEDDIVRTTLRSGNPEFCDIVFEGHIFLDQSCSGVALPACLRNYVCKTSDTGDVSHCGCTFSRTHPNPALLQNNQIEWAEGSMSPADFGTFEGSVETFIKTFVTSGEPLQRYRPQFSFLERVHVFKSAYKMLRVENFYFVQPNGRAPRELPVPAQAELRGVARAAFELSERDIHNELDKYLKTPTISDQDRPIIWTALWQLIFIYRDLLRNVRPFENNADVLFNAVAVFYATLFRTKAALTSLNEVNSAWLPNDSQHDELVRAFNHTLSLRDTFYQSIVAGVSSVDERLKIIVVNPEMKVLSRRMTKKTDSAKGGAAQDHDGDEIMGGC